MDSFVTDLGHQWDLKRVKVGAVL